ncbi:hypothetical protein BDR06DRAFT_317669 [Suillus hirtellus]|nr:hypothetical protein BDR06DRAFT_317669 [Suillus hirtellus]
MSFRRLHVIEHRSHYPRESNVLDQSSSSNLRGKSRNIYGKGLRSCYDTWPITGRTAGQLSVTPNELD